MIKKQLFLLIPLLFAFTQACAAEFIEGKDYVSLNQPVKTSHDGKIVVTEVFWYGCPHCFRFEPYIEKWSQSQPDNVVFEKIPSVLNSRWMDHARAYFAFEAMGITDKIHQKLFNAIHLQNKHLPSLEKLAEFVAQQGFDEKEFRKNFHSFPVDTQVRKNKQKERKYGHRGVPAVIVNGKYRTTGSMAGSNARLIQVIEFLIAKEQKILAKVTG